MSLILPAGSSVASPPALRKTFQDHPKTPACRIVSRGFGRQLKNTDARLYDFVNHFMTSLKEVDEKGLGRYLHPKLKKRTVPLGRQLLASLRHRYQTPWSWSVYRVWGLNTVNGDKITLECPGGDGVLLTAVYGYPIQAAIWIQLMAKNELARIYIAATPWKKGWVISGLHLQQWTHSGRDFEAWSRKGVSAAQKGQKVAAHFYFDAAQKLLFGGDFVDFPFKNDILQARNDALSKEGLRQLVEKALPPAKILYAGTVLANDGVGILIREEVSPDKALKDLQTNCRRQGRSLKKQQIPESAAAGIRCEFIMKGENPEREGQLGGVYFPRTKLSK